MLTNPVIPKELLKAHIIEIANAIEAGYILDLDTKGELVAQATWGWYTQKPSPAIAYRLRAVLLTSIEANLNKELKNELNLIRKVRDQIFGDPSNSRDGWTLLPADVQNLIFQYLPYRQIQRLKEVRRSWHTGFPSIQIAAINNREILLLNSLTQYPIILDDTRIPEKKDTKSEPVTAKQIVDWICTNPYGQDLTYANFKDTYDFDDDCLKRLSLKCPKLTHLIIPNNHVTNLNGLQCFPFLRHLDLTYSQRLQPDALKNLIYTPLLQTLKLHAAKFDTNCLSNLSSVPLLTELDLTYCSYLVPLLPLLRYVPRLKTLMLNGWREHAIHAIPHLHLLPHLQHLDLTDAGNLIEDALNNHPHSISNLESLNLAASQIKTIGFLIHLPKLKVLDVGGTSISSLDPLMHTTELRSLCIACCRQLDPPNFQTIIKISTLTDLDMRNCLRLFRNDLGLPIPLSFPPSFGLKKLNISHQMIFLTFWNSLSNLSNLEHLNAAGVKFPFWNELSRHINLKYLDISCNDLTSLGFLRSLPELLVLNIKCCNDLPPYALNQLAYVTKLEELDISACTQLDDPLSYLAFVPFLQKLILDSLTESIPPDSLQRHHSKVSLLESVSINGTFHIRTNFAPQRNWFIKFLKGES